MREPSPTSNGQITSFIWSLADHLRGIYKQGDYGKVILPFTVLRRLDCVLAPTKAAVLARYQELEGRSAGALEPALEQLTGLPFYNRSELELERLLDEPEQLAARLTAYIEGFSEVVRELFIERFELPAQIAKLDDAGLLAAVVERFAAVDLHPSRVDNHQMGRIYEELIRRFAELSNETAGEHFTPREVIRLMVDLLFVEDEPLLRQPGVARTLFDPACGTGGMLSVARERLRELNPQARLELFGQELNDASFAVCRSDMMIKGEAPENIARGNSLSHDGHAGARFDYMLSNPPFGVDWKQVKKAVAREHEQLGFGGRFGPGLPRVSDGSLLFLLHMCSKMKRSEGGTRLALVLNGAPLFTGDAGSGESEIRRWLLESDLLEAIIGLPDQLFYNTGISTYIWLINNRKPERRKGKVQLIDARGMCHRLRKSLGSKRHALGDEDRRAIVRLYQAFVDDERSKIFANEAFGYQKITVERPLRVEFQVTPARIEGLRRDRAFVKLARSTKIGAGELAQAAIVEVLERFDSERVFLSRERFAAELTGAMKAAEIELPASVEKAIFALMAERNEALEPVLDARGEPVPDADLRDIEQVPLRQSVEEYMAREVLPHVPDAWVDPSKTKIGYEIPFTRHFYEREPLRPLEQIEAEIRGLELQIRGMLEEVLA